MTCSVPGCKSIRRLLPPDSDISFHQVPKGKQFHKYLDILGKKNIGWKSTLLICSKHFKIEDITVKGGRRYLRYNALPMLHLMEDVWPSSPKKARMSGASEDALVSQNLPGPNHLTNIVKHGDATKICSASPNMTSTIYNCTIKAKEEEPYYLQTVTETSTYQDTAITTQNVQASKNPTPKQALLINRPILPKQQLLYQLQRTTDDQQDLLYLIVPTNENIQAQSLPLTVVKQQQSATQNVGNSELNIQHSDRTNSATIVHDVKVEINETEIYQEDVSSNEEKNIHHLYIPKTNAKQNTSDSPTANTNFNQVHSKSTPNKKDNAVADIPHCYHCDYNLCAASFYSLYEKYKHLDTHVFSDSTELKCSICNMIFEEATERNKHVGSHAVPPRFKCKQCQKDFSYFTVLMKHLEEKKCTLENPVTCFFCEVKITDYDELVRHNHLNMKQCICGIKICGNQAYELHLSVCRLMKNSEEVQSPY